MARRLEKRPYVVKWVDKRLLPPITHFARATLRPPAGVDPLQSFGQWVAHNLNRFTARMIGFGRDFCYSERCIKGAHPWQKHANSRRSCARTWSATARLAGADEDRTLARLRGVAQRSDRSDDRRRIMGASSSAQATAALVEFRSVVDAVRCAIEVQNAHGRAQRRRARGPPHRLPHRHSSRRRRRGERRRPYGRWRQHRRAIGGRCRAGRDLSVRGRLPAGEGAARSRRHRSRADAAQEHRRAGTGVFVASRRTGSGAAGDAAQAARAEETIHARAARRRDRRPRRDRGRNMVFARRKPRRARRRDRAGAGRGPRISPSSCCRSRTSLAMRARIISPTASPRI